MSPGASGDQGLVSPEKPPLDSDSERVVQHAADILNVSFNDLLGVVPLMRSRGQSSSADEQNIFPQWNDIQGTVVNLAAKALNISLADLVKMSALLRPAKSQDKLDQAPAITTSDKPGPGLVQSEDDGSSGWLAHSKTTRGTGQHFEGNEDSRAQSSSGRSSIAIFTPPSGSGVDSSAQSSSNLNNELIITPSASSSRTPVPSPPTMDSLVVEAGASLSGPEPGPLPDSLEITILNSDVVGNRSTLLSNADFDDSLNFYGLMDDHSDYFMWDSFTQHQDMNIAASSPSNFLPMPGDSGATGEPPRTSRVQKSSKSRRHLTEDERKQAKVTRGCVPDDGDPSGECLTCRRMDNPIKNMPCIRKKIEDSSFHPERSQPEQYWSQRWKSWTVEGSIQEIKGWDGVDIRIINTTQDIGRAFDTYKVRKVVPAEGDSMTRQWLSKATGERMHHPVTPYAIENMAEAARGILRNCDDHITDMIEHYTKSSDRLIRDTFKMAQKHSVDDNVDVAERRLIRKVLQLWVATRRLSKPARISSPETLEIQPQRIDTTRSDYGQVPVPPLISVQISILSEVLILRPLRDSVRNGLAKMLEKYKDRYFTIYLCIFILLHSYSLVTQYYHRKAKHLRLHAKYSALRELEALHGSANILLTHFHFCGNGSGPFEDGWSKRHIEALGLSESQASFLRDTSQHKNRIGRETERIIASGIFHHDLYFVAQMFDLKWKIPGLTVASCAVDS
ncbi:hypothetical protein J7T55_013025 [Diaporthe amygdali]|uniref:uncharacterized protein n=1 Tax=Phomopsis amygdali TaxID=1214568 RepID=UPI0022FEA155|nr:uncharacterized protein J7T55_013025 [Diaporthe amygdali]KAJ0118771.1 hypothetical protein J7T55_013025 [Diaporthe amygdali]